jgi:hypothetical protein
VIQRFRQRVGGVEVFNRDISVLMDRNNRLVAIAGYFASQADATSLAAAKYSLSAPQAIVKAFANLGGKVGGNFTAGATKGAYRTWARPAGQGDLQLEADPRVKPVLYALNGKIVPGYYIELSAATRDGARQLDYGYVVSAEDGSVLFRKNLTTFETATPYTYRMLADKYGVPYDSPLGNGMEPFKKFDYTKSVPRKDVASRLITQSASNKISTQDPWLANGATSTSGNNVKAYLDLASPNGYSPARGDVMATTTAANTFDYPLQGDVDPSTTPAKNAAVVNLFYMNNWLHDFWYDHGFNEAAGNAQARTTAAAASKATRSWPKARTTRPQQRQHVHAGRRRLAAHADVPVRRPGHRRIPGARSRPPWPAS